MITSCGAAVLAAAHHIRTTVVDVNHMGNPAPGSRGSVYPDQTTGVRAFKLGVREIGPGKSVKGGVAVMFVQLIGSLLGQLMAAVMRFRG